MENPSFFPGGAHGAYFYLRDADYLAYQSFRRRMDFSVQRFCHSGVRHPFCMVFFILHRLRERVSIFQPDKRHLHYKLMELGWSERRIAWFFFGVTALIALIALNTQALGKFLAFLLVLGILFSILLFVDFKTRKKEGT